MRKRLFGLFSVIALVLTLGLFVGEGSSSAATITCASRTKHWAIQEGGVSVRVGWVELHLQVCTNGTKITSTSETSDSDVTGPATAAGFKVSVGKPYRNGFNSGGFGGGSANYRADGTTRDCLPGGITVWCSDTENWKVVGHVNMLDGLIIKATKANQIVLHGRVFGFVWSAGCTNSVCATRFL